MEKTRNSALLKITCYIITPIIFATFILSILHMAFLNEFANEKETKYVQTESFANNYLNVIINKVTYYCQNDNFIELEDEKGNIYYYTNEQNTYNYYNGIGTYIDYVIIEKETGKMFTNIKSSDYQKTKDDMKNHEIYWNFADEKIDTNLEYINQTNIKYNYNYSYYSKMTSIYSKHGTVTENNFKDYEVYSCYNEEKTKQPTRFTISKNFYDNMLQNREYPIYNCLISIVVLIAIIAYLLWSIGHKKGKEGIYLNALDKIPYEIVSIVSIWIICIMIEILANIGDFSFSYMFITTLIITYVISYIAFCILCVTTIKRLKAKQFIKSFLTYKIINWLCQKAKKIIHEINSKTVSSKKIFWYYWGFIIISVILGTLISTVITIILLIAFWIWTFYKIKKYNRQQDEIKQALEKIYQGKTDIYIDIEELEGTLKQMAIYVNDIAGGFSNAIEESLQSERLKTELITNVSHDIKTPLTSIINYVDLLKKEDIKNEKVQEYIKILDQKSQRLKKLTEDLVEASKVSSGNVKLNIEEINLKELINQSIGEFRDKFEEKNLKIETNIPNEPIKIKADNRYMFRVIENLFSNITKYAQENSRVYIDMKNEKNHIEISIKNISKDKLNISSDELMQRFVRGDKSRYTEGSGLGLSIAKSLVELQGGEFEIIIDGDLFKVLMQW